MPRGKKRPTFRFQIAIRSVAEVEIKADSLEEAYLHVNTKEGFARFLKDHPPLGPDYEEVDGNQRVLGVYEMDPGWSFLEK